MNWGIFDTRDKCWLGDANGPKSYQDELMARAAATIVNQQFRTLIRFRPRLLPKDKFRIKDEIEAPVTAEEALIELKA